MAKSPRRKWRGVDWKPVSVQRGPFGRYRAGPGYVMSSFLLECQPLALVRRCASEVLRAVARSVFVEDYAETQWAGWIGILSVYDLGTGDAHGRNVQGVASVLCGKPGSVRGDAGSVFALGYAGTREIYRSYDLATKQGHETLFDALEQFGVEIPGVHSLHVEVLSL